MTKARLVMLGKIGRPHGVHGEVRLFLFNPESESLAAGSTIVVHCERGDENIVLESVRYVDKGVLARFKNVAGRDAVERYKNCDFSISYDQLPPAEEGEFYHIDLIGLDVFLSNDENDELQSFGVVDRFFDSGINDVMVVRQLDGKELFVPMFDDTIEDIDVNLGRVILAPLEGWAPAESNNKRDRKKGSES